MQKASTSLSMSKRAERETGTLSPSAVLRKKSSLQPFSSTYVQHRLEGLPISLYNEIVKGCAYDFIKGLLYKFRKTAVAVEDRTVFCHRDRALGHRLHEGAVGPFCALKGEDLWSFRSVDDKRVKLVVCDRPEGLFGLLKA